jgi:hypothetical protein
MAWVRNLEAVEGHGRMYPSQVVARSKVFRIDDSRSVLQIDTTGSEDRENLGKLSQTLQFGDEAAHQLYRVLRDSFGFK